MRQQEINQILKHRPYTLNLSQLEEGMMFSFPHRSKRYIFEGKGYKKYFYSDAFENMFETKLDCKVSIIYT